MTISISNLSDAPPSSATPAQRPGRRQLRPQDVLAIVERRRAGESAFDVATRFGVTTESVRLILCGKRWARITGIRPQDPKGPNETHATILLRTIAEDPMIAPVVCGEFDRRFGRGGAVKTIAQLMQHGGIQ